MDFTSSALAQHLTAPASPGIGGRVPSRRARPRVHPEAAPVASVHCEAGGLLYVDDGIPGFTRRTWRGKTHYFDGSGERIKDPQVIRRINALVIPPAYTDVWICPAPDGHIQATARDARGRKQYRYHERWTAIRDADKYQQLAQFGQALPRIRRDVAASLKVPGLGQEKVMAVVVRLLETTLIRIGTRAYVKTNKSFGLTTLRHRHASVLGERIRFQFRGKSGIEHDVTVNDRRLARIVKRCMEIPGHSLFRYIDDDGAVHEVDSGAVNAYLHRVGKGEFTAKHYRTWAGSVFAMAQLQKQPWQDEDSARKVVVGVVKDVARRLGNTPAVCRACYIHPEIIDAYMRGELPPAVTVSGPRGLNADERRLLHFLKARPDTGMPIAER